MQRMFMFFGRGHASQLCAFLIAASCWMTAISPAQGQVIQADYDYEASGFVTPAGVLPPQQSQFNRSGIMQVGYAPMGGCDSPGCDSPGCTGGCASGGCDSMGYGSAGRGPGGCMIAGGGGYGATTGGLFAGLAGAGSAGGSCGMNGCGGGNGCGLFGCGGGCGLLGGSGGCGPLGCGGGALLGALSKLQPYSEGGLCQQRWYDVSLGLMFLGKTNAAPGTGQGFTSQGIGGPIVLGMDDLDTGSLEEGLRLSGALLLGPGGNIEATWVGGHEWGSSARVQDPTANLFSFVSDFGANPGGTAQGFDDTDRSIVQTVQSDSDFDSLEINYRRRTVWPNCRYQGSWLIGLRYLRYDDAFAYRTRGTVNNAAAANTLRFFSTTDRIDNKMLGAQAGGDFWLNVRPGFSFGVGAKLGIMQNDMNRNTLLTANSLGAGATVGTASLEAGAHETTFMGEFEAKLAYRLSHSWTLRSSYYLVGVEDVAFGGIDLGATSQFIDPTRPGTTPVLFADTEFNSLVVQGFSIEAEYMW